ncbi:MAG TPA: zinc-binding dehydrogenase [Amycolatopsis sp.]|uniref:zinc-binding dehydrogenase n=1 Tax=Amycolatopsis sp. TaxID=37632 RepID=UPI002B4A947F|nr:zinc-binding dehydrogenase [Amycolatopsis sp.]HKS44326.1 zinc-binding dehydrogenase [Amycolatopsis sp.]
MIPSGTKLTAFHSDHYKGTAGAKASRDIVDGVTRGGHLPNVDRVFRLDGIVEAHRYMEDNLATGKVVMPIDQAATNSRLDTSAVTC